MDGGLPKHWLPVHCEENEITKEMMNDDTRIYPNN